MTDDKIVIGISHGDINSISYEVIIKALMDKRILEMCTPVIYGSPKVAAYHRKALNIENFSMNNITSADQANDKRVNIIDCFTEELKVELGKSTDIAGKASVDSLQKAVQDLKDGLLHGLVTGPINKDNTQSEQFNFPGHTEYLKAQFGVDEVLMILVNENLRVGVATGHVPLKDVSGLITKELLLQKINIFNKSLKEDFGIRKPKIAILGLNPHAGDNGLLGSEEIDQIIPAIQTARDKGILALGPYPADGFFGSGDFDAYDGVLAMYHDQGLAPFKALAFDKGVNYTAGLPVVRTSPGHGTAFTIAGNNKASEDSFRNALYLAIDIFKRKKQYTELTENPLQ
ncbi:MAG: 4-hydroxythreonine-4-phosphate dehydrogenase PdxA [Bacteroidales bacterium]|nr:4-hydroxythreonine-4-phosphate dehydrogenase PdxA [Bacteroidales bacterium]